MTIDIGSDRSAEQTFVELALGKALTSDEACDLTVKQRTQLVMIAGAPKTGKTTLLAGLLHRFQRGPFAGLLFAGSLTLPDLDRRCHLARTNSLRETADTDRTRPGESRSLVHIRFREEDLSRVAEDVLFTDLSGEDYKAARNSPDECKAMALIPRSDHFVVLLDAEVLLSENRRQAAKHDALTLLRCCVESGQLGKDSLVDVLVNKWDVVEALADKDCAAVEFISGVEKAIESQFGDKLGRLRFGHVALRPELAPKLALCHGMSEFLRSWVYERPQTGLTNCPPLNEPDSQSEFDKFRGRASEERLT